MSSDTGGTTCPLSGPGQFTGGGSIMLKIKKMIADNYAMIGLFVILSIILGFILQYFGKSLYKTISTYYMYRTPKSTTPIPSISNNSKIVAADNYIYDDEEEPTPDDIQKYMEAGKRRFVKDVEIVYDEYNKALDDELRTMGKVTNDAKIDSSIMFKTNDAYNYEINKYD
jgi:hypothetical protein